MYIVRPSYLLRKIYPKAIWRMAANEKKIYLTFDDGPVPIVTSSVLDVLKAENVKATFFCVGENVARNSEIYQRILDEKHAVGNHTFNHLKGWKTHGNEYIRNVIKCAALIDTKLFRPPYGRIKKSQLALISKQYSVIMWDVLSGDYDKRTSPQQCLKNVTENVRNGSVIVFHDSHKAQRNMEFALPRFIKYAKENGFEFAVL
ncbi:MAG: polysaccharide deacetylase family protein [Bacteroidetes bacterium]|nr:polysaccharide deacetylase family protein [Bacteroidota bacterium]